MNSPESLNNKHKNLLDLITTNWESLDESQKLVFTKIWKVLTYKWQLQILFNLPFLISIAGYKLNLSISHNSL